MNSYGLIPKILSAIQQAKTPTRFSQDFLSTSLAFTGGSARAFPPFAKRLGLIADDGSPTELYKSFRDPNRTKSAMAAAIRKGYESLFDRNEYADKLDRAGLEGLLIQITGLDSGSQTLKAIASSFEAVKRFADFDQSAPDQVPAPPQPAIPLPALPSPALHPANPADGQEFRMNLSYTINLNLPKSDDVAVFNAIFKALRENLLKT
jgi:hypothetical protein